MQGVDVINVDVAFRQGTLEHVRFGNSFFGISRGKQVFGKLQSAVLTQCQQAAITQFDRNNRPGGCLDDFSHVDGITLKKSAGFTRNGIDRVGNTFKLGNFADNLRHAECSLTNGLLYRIR